MIKKCRKCKIERSIGEFAAAVRNKDGLHSYCIHCERIRGKEYYYKKLGKPIPITDLIEEGYKKCSQCYEVKSFDLFYVHKGRPDSLRSECKECVAINGKKWRINGGSNYMRIYSKNRKRNTMIKIIQYLLEHPCVDCGEDNPLKLEFDHTETPVNRVTSLLSRSWDFVLEEIQKCEVRCGSCHTFITHKRADSLRYQVWNGWANDD